MSALIYGIIDAVNIGLNAHYDAVTSVVLWIYNVAVTIGHALQQSYDSMVVAYDVLRTLIIDLVGHAILFAKLTLYVIHRMSLAVQFVFLIIDNLIILVYDGCKWIMLGIIQIFSALLDALMLILNLPLYIISSVNDNLLWCYRELSSILYELATLVVQNISSLLYTILLLPYYILTYLWQIIVATINVTVRLAELLPTVAGDLVIKLTQFFYTSTIQLTSSISSALSVYYAVVSSMYTDLVLVVYNCTRLGQQASDWLHHAHVVLLFMEEAEFPYLLFRILMTPPMLINVLVRDFASYINSLLSILSNSKSKTQGLTDGGHITSPLLSIERSLYCIIEELLWVVWLTVKANLALIIFWGVFLAALYIALKQQRSLSITTTRHRVDADRRDSEAAQQHDDQDHSEVDYSSSDSEEDVAIHIPRIRSRQRVSRSRSQTPDLSTPGAETRYIHKLRRKVEDEKNNRQCIICHDNVKNIILLPCRHLCVCGDCAQQLVRRRPKSCPLCREKINQVMEVFT